MSLAALTAVALLAAPPELQAAPFPTPPQALPAPATAGQCRPDPASAETPEALARRFHDIAFQQDHRGNRPLEWRRHGLKRRSCLGPAFVRSVQPGRHEPQQGEARVTRQGRPITGSEDFAFMLEKCPGSYWLIGNGAGEGKSGGGCMVHNPGYDFNDDILPVGAAFWALLTQRYLKD